MSSSISISPTNRTPTSAELAKSFPVSLVGGMSREVTDSPNKLFFLNIFYLTQNVCVLEFQKPEGKSVRVRVCWDSKAELWSMHTLMGLPY